MRITRRAFLVAMALAPLACAPRRRQGPIILGVRTSNCQAPFYVADRQGLYAAQGLDVVVRLVPNNTEIVEALQRGDFQIGSVPITTAIAAITHGAPLHIVAMTGRGSDGLLVRKADGINSLADLRGKKIATIRASILDVLLYDALARQGLDPTRDVEMVYMGQLGDMIASLKTAQVEATSNTEPFMTDAELQGWGHILTYYTAQWPDHPCCVVVARDDFARSQPRALRGVLEAHCQAVQWANDNLRETAQTIVDYLQAFDAELVHRTLHPTKMRLDCHLVTGEVERMAGLMETQGLVERVPGRTRLVDDRPLGDILGTHR